MNWTKIEDEETQVENTQTVEPQPESDKKTRLQKILDFNLEVGRYKPVEILCEEEDDESVKEFEFGAFKFELVQLGRRRAYKVTINKISDEINVLQRFYNALSVAIEKMEADYKYDEAMALVKGEEARYHPDYSALRLIYGFLSRETNKELILIIPDPYGKKHSN